MEQQHSSAHRLRLTGARLHRQWSQAELAEQLGTTQVNVSRWERGITSPSRYFREKLCQLFGKSTQELDLEASAPAASEIVIYDPAIPPRLPILVGRNEQLSYLKQQLQNSQGISPTVLYGLPGVGKTTVAISLAHDQELRSHFRDGILWVGLGPTPNVASLLARWGTLLGLAVPEKSSRSSSTAWIGQLRATLTTRAMLLIIDDAWQEEDARAFLLGGPMCACLVTTRFPLIANQLVVEERIALPELTLEQGLHLLQRLAPSAVTRERQRAQDLVQAVGGLPLALTLMGNYLRTQSYSGQPRRIQAALDRLRDANTRLLLSEPPITREAHPGLNSSLTLSLQSVIAVTDQQLPPALRQALYALAVFPAKPHSFSEAAALAVAVCPVDTLDVLTDTGLVESQEAGRYSLHQTIADYARLQQQDSSADERLIAYTQIYVHRYKADYEQLEAESSMIMSAIEAAQTLGQQRELVQLVSAFVPFLLLRGNYTLAAHYAQYAYSAAHALNDEPGMTSALMYQGEAAYKQGENAQAQSYYQQALTLARRTGHQPHLSDLLQRLGRLYWKQGQYAQAEAHFQEGLSIARQIDYYECVMDLLSGLGAMVADQGVFTQANAYLREGLALARMAEDRERICDLLINLGVVATQFGKFLEGESYLQEALVLARHLQLHEWISLILLNLGSWAMERPEYLLAEEYLQEGLQVARRIGNMEWLCVLLISYAELANRQRHNAVAEAYLQESAPLIQQLNMPRITSYYLDECGYLALHQQRWSAAQDAFQQMLSVGPEGNPEMQARALYGLAQVARAQGQQQQAVQFGEQSVAIMQTIKFYLLPKVQDWLASITE